MKLSEEDQQFLREEMFEDERSILQIEKVMNQFGFDPVYFITRPTISIMILIVMYDYIINEFILNSWNFDLIVFVIMSNKQYLGNEYFFAVMCGHNPVVNTFSDDTFGAGGSDPRTV